MAPGQQSRRNCIGTRAFQPSLCILLCVQDESPAGAPARQALALKQQKITSRPAAIASQRHFSRGRSMAAKTVLVSWCRKDPDGGACDETRSDPRRTAVLLSCEVERTDLAGHAGRQ